MKYNRPLLNKQQIKDKQVQFWYSFVVLHIVFATLLAVSLTFMAIGKTRISLEVLIFSLVMGYLAIIVFVNLRFLDLAARLKN